MEVAFVSYVVPAMLFTLLAVVLASIILSKKPISDSPSKTKREVTKIGLAEGADERKDLAQGLIDKADKGEAGEEVAAEITTRIKEQNELAVPSVTPAENTGVLDENPGFQARLGPGKSDVKDALPEVQPQTEAVEEAEPAAVPQEVVAPLLLPQAAPDQEASSPASAAREPPHIAESESPELLTEEETGSSPVFEEHSVIGAASEEEDDQSLKYAPGKLRTSQLEKMMTEEELEEEQRVQREQLAAIFKLLRDNKDTFGDVTEGDVEEQLKLYSI
ncbi:hypothetical protein GJAV_G00267540 [Gymnothorax javanicus]|nr:hypothetical protein GJAV_G00267540 [Gymnothorax javanicus]